MARQRDALARGGQVSLAHHAVLVVAQLIGCRREQIDQHLVVVGLTGALPTGHALGHGHHQGVAERFVILGQVVDARAGQRGPARQGRRAIVGEAAGTELEAQRRKERVDAAAIPDQIECVGGVITDRLDAQRQARGIDAGHGRDTHLAGQVAGGQTGAATDAKDLAGARRVERDLGQDGRQVQAVPEAQIELGVAGCGAGGGNSRQQRDQRQFQAVQVGSGQRIGAVVGVVS